MKRKQLIFWPLLVAFIAASSVWMISVPRGTALQPSRAIPASATFLGVHRDLNERWDVLAHNPLLLGLVDKLGVNSDEVERINQDPGFHELLRVLGTDDLWLAYVPAMRATGASAWVFSTWLGGESLRLRWLLRSGRMPDIKRAASRNGWLVWVWAPRELKGQRITFAVVEGMLVGCIAAETHGIDEVLACVDGNAQSLASRADFIPPLPASAADRGWYRNERGEYFPYELSLDANGALEGSVQTPWALPPPSGSAQNGLDGWGDMVANRAVAAAAFDRALVRNWFSATFTNLVGREVVNLLSDDRDGPVGAALLGGEFGGRFMAVRLPTLLLGIAGSPSNQVKEVSDALDRLNALSRWGLVASKGDVSHHSVYAIEATAGGVYSGLAREEILAFAPVADGIVWSSNLAIMERLVKEYPSAGEIAANPWRSSLQKLASGQARGFLWFDAAEGAKVVRLGVTAWSLKLLLEDPEGTQETRQRMNDFKAWMDALSPLGQVAVGWEDRNGYATITLHAGEF